MKENTKRYQCPNCGWTASEEIEKEHLEHCHAGAYWSQSASGSEKMINGKLFQDAVSVEK